jgi:hypothetical protein
MIVLCPTCSTRYRHDPAGDAPTGFAACSHCDGRIPLVEGRRNFVLLPRAVPSVRAIGCDDPLVAARVAASRPAEIAAAPLARETTAFTSAAEAVAERTPTIPLGGGVADAAGPPEAAPTEAELPGPATPRRRSAALEFAAAVVPPAVGAGLAYAFAAKDQLDPVAWSALGGAVGFLLGWVGLLWLRRSR